MSSCRGYRCDRCGARSLGRENDKLPAGWGQVLMVRMDPYLHTGDLDLCLTCFEWVHKVVRSPTKTDM